MSKKHRTSEWQLLVRTMKPRLLAALPAPCMRCGQPMTRGQKLDVGHINLDPQLRFSPHNVRLEHRTCNRRHGQQITTALRNARSKTRKRDLPSW